ncbi:type II toxin-antitoxin system RelE family toxin [Lederbergia lenta]|uniref:type II toxin-antitoxin system RelE family toxin n=1 Tax=Lederbergia lenta TaxID=1467 RepID=UPI00203BDF65|nr:type II toxin-antitoxin system RelE/ParE family toxin [Lederbergia lenta]MCM3110005.1 type II toxin-antitoxin system RelE/ParE family toxin [Lederbergia lenta]
MYNITLSKKTKKYIDKQDKVTKRRIKNSLLTLAENPYSQTDNDIKQLKGYEETFRLRIGDIRVIYEVYNNKLIIHIINIGNRGNIYKNL